MRKLLFAGLLISTCANAQDANAPPPLDPAAVVKQLYALSDKKWSGAASYSIYADGSVHFSVSLPNDVRVYSSGATTEDALNDLRRQSDLIASTVVVKAEHTRGSALSLVEGIKAMLFGNRKSQ